MKRKPLKSGFLILAVLVACLACFSSSCKKDDEPKEVTFETSPGNFVLKVDSIPDSTGVDGPMYSENARISNNFFRTACENNSVYLGDVSSVKIKSASVSIGAGQPADFGDFKNLYLHTWFNQYGYTLLGDNLSPDSTSSSQGLSIKDVELKDYFMLLEQDYFLFLTQNTAAFPDTADVTVLLNFTVTGTDH